MSTEAMLAGGGAAGARAGGDGADARAGGGAADARVGGGAADAQARSFDLDRPWQLHPQVSVRPERFGALLYHFGTRRLSFLKSPALLTVVRGLGDAPTARDACGQAGVTAADLPAYTAALATLADSQMIRPREDT